MQLHVVTIEPVQQAAAEPATLDAFTAVLQARQTGIPAEPGPVGGRVGSLFDIPLVNDPSLPRGVVYLRPMPRPPILRPGMLHAPWTPHDVQTLNRFQRESGMHPFTCGGDHQHASPTLVATPAGWECPDDDCTYTQGWAHTFMTIPETWPATGSRA